MNRRVKQVAKCIYAGLSNFINQCLLMLLLTVSSLFSEHPVLPLWNLQNTLMMRMAFLKNYCKRLQSTISKQWVILQSHRNSVDLFPSFDTVVDNWMSVSEECYNSDLLTVLAFSPQGTRTEATFCSARDVWVWVLISLESSWWDGETAEGPGGQEH